MDPELAQRFDEISRHFTAINQRFEQLNGRFEQLNGRLDARFGAIDARFERIDVRFERIDARFGAIDDRFLAMDEQFEELKDRVEESKRYSGILVEGLRYEVHLVADGLATFIDGRYTQDQASIQRQFRETQALMHLSYDQLRQRVENIENRGQN
jgi:predicted nuclease with TOPRIM domain